MKKYKLSDFFVGVFIIGSILFLSWSITNQEYKKIENILAQENINYANLKSHSSADYDFVVRPTDNGSKKVCIIDKHTGSSKYFIIDKYNNIQAR